MPGEPDHLAECAVRPASRDDPIEPLESQLLRTFGRPRVLARFGIRSECRCSRSPSHPQPNVFLSPVHDSSRPPSMRDRHSMVHGEDYDLSISNCVVLGHASTQVCRIETASRASFVHVPPSHRIPFSRRATCAAICAVRIVAPGSAMANGFRRRLRRARPAPRERVPGVRCAVERET